MKRKLVPEILSESEEKYRTFFENSLDAIMITEPDGTICSANPAACSMLGYNEEEICKLGRKGLVEQNSQLKEALKRRRESGIFLGELVIIKKDGSKFPVEISSSVFTNSDGREQTAMIIRDITERKKTEQVLKKTQESLVESKELLTSIIDSTSDLIWSVDPFTFKLLTFNNALEQFLKNENIHIEKGNLLSDFLPEELVKRLSDLYSRTLKEGSLFTEYQTTIGNLTLWININLLSRDGKPYAISVFAKNVTELKQSEVALKQAHDWQEKIFEGSLDAIFISDENSVLIAVNKAASDLTGYSKEELLKMRIPDLHDEPDLEAYRKFYKRIFKGEKILSEAKILRKDGIKVDTEFSNSRISISGKYYMHTTARDVTDRKKLEKEMYSASLYARNLIEASLDPLVTISVEGKITDVNLATEKITGMTREKLIGSDFADYFDNPDKAKRVYKTVFLEGIVKDYPLTVLHKSGRRIDVLYNATLFKNEFGEVQGVFAAAHDITKLKKIEEELRKSKKLLEKLNQHLVEVRENERNEIALNLHDDLGQKLTAINLDIAWLKSRIGVQSKTVREKLEEMSSIIKETIENIKETSALLRPAILFDLGLVPAIKSQLGSFEKQTGIKCNFYFRPEEFILEDRLSLILFRILQESMTNIARHSGASKADINLHILKNKIELIIKDDGTGIEKNIVNSFKSLGIAGIRERVNSVNGKMTIVGSPGSGTMISVKIPLLKVKTND